MIERALLDVRAIRRDFPVLERQVHGKPLIYLDNAATSQKPEAVLRALDDYYRRYNANVHRGVHTLAEEATAAYEEARKKVARFVGTADPRQIIFTKNATEALNLVAYAWGLRNLRPGDEVALTVMEHHSNLVPWQIVARRTGARLRYFDIDDGGKLVLDPPEPVITDRTRLVALAYVSNMLGTINPVAEVVARAHAAGALVVVDASQAAPHLPLQLDALGADFVAFTGHKMCGPTGVGVLYGRYDRLAAMDPFLGGGEMIRQVRLDGSDYQDPPARFEAGTPNIAQAIGLGAAVDYLTGVGMPEVRAHEEALVAYALEALGRLDGVTIYGPRTAAERGGVVAFNVAGIHAHDLASVLDQEEGVAIRAGHHCAEPLHRRLGLTASARASFYLYNLPEEIDALVRGIKKAQALFG